jgi:predicted adenylyl cyclase CyaB
LPLGQGADFAAQFAEILTALSFRRVSQVSKERHRYGLTWDEHDFEVALDRVATVGTFAELEVMAENDALPAAEAALASLASRLQLASIERRSYLEMVLQKQAGQ